MPEMAVPEVRTRFAPSPTGRIHVGNARTALFNYFLARQAGGRFVLRVEDTDRERSRAEFYDAALADLSWLGLEWDEGPDDGGDHGPYCQSERGDVYDDLFRRLEASGPTYECYCTPAQLVAVRKDQIRRGEAPRYAGTCRELTESDRRQRRQSGLLPSLRFRVDEADSISFDDVVRGETKFRLSEIGDFIVRRADGTPNFLFGNAVDDALMGITLVVRGEDHVSNTPRQLLILDALGLGAPAYGHIPLLVGADGRPLSKREGATAVANLADKGYCREAVWNYLGRLGHHYESDNRLTGGELIQRFSVEHISRSPARYDTGQLDYWQRSVVHTAAHDELTAWLGGAMLEIVPEPVRGRFLDIVQPNLMYPEDAATWAEIIFGRPAKLNSADESLLKEAGPEFFQAALKALEGHGPDIRSIARDIGNQTGRTGKSIFMPLRLALTGRRDGPELKPLLLLMTPESVRERLAAHTG